MSLLLDWPLFSYGPMAMSFGAYMGDIGLTYLIFPMITVTLGYLLQLKGK